MHLNNINNNINNKSNNFADPVWALLIFWHIIEKVLH